MEVEQKGFYPQASASLLFWVSKTLGMKVNLDEHTLIKCTGDVRSRSSSSFELLSPRVNSCSSCSHQCSLLTVPGQLSLQKAYLGPQAQQNTFSQTVFFLCSSKKTGTACWQAGSKRNNICRNPRFNSRIKF